MAHRNPFAVVVALGGAVVLLNGRETQGRLHPRASGQGGGGNRKMAQFEFHGWRWSMGVSCCRQIPGALAGWEKPQPRWHPREPCFLSRPFAPARTACSALQTT